MWCNLTKYKPAFVWTVWVAKGKTAAQRYSHNVVDKMKSRSFYAPMRARGTQTRSISWFTQNNHKHKSITHTIIVFASYITILYQTENGIHCISWHWWGFLEISHVTNFKGLLVFVISFGIIIPDVLWASVVIQIFLVSTINNLKQKNTFKFPNTYFHSQ